MTPPNPPLSLHFQAVDRLHRDWDPVAGWGHPWKPAGSPKQLYFRGERKAVTVWDFNSADMDQGLQCHYFILTHGNAVLIDTEVGKAKVFTKGFFSTGGADSDPVVRPAAEALQCCNGQSPLNYFAHFTGRSKPWMNIPPLEDIEQYLKPVPDQPGARQIVVPTSGKDPSGKRLPAGAKNILVWLRYLDELQLPGVNSTSIGAMNLGSPLGFFNAKFPKGGFTKTKDGSE